MRSTRRSLQDADRADPAAALWARRRALNDRELARLRARWDGPIVELPLLPVEPGPPLLGALAKRLERQGWPA